MSDDIQFGKVAAGKEAGFGSEDGQLSDRVSGLYLASILLAFAAVESSCQMITEQNVTKSTRCQKSAYLQHNIEKERGRESCPMN